MTGAGGEAADDGRQRALHAGDHDDDVGVISSSTRREQAVHAGHAAVGHAVRRDAECVERGGHSSATGRSAVPAVTTGTRAGRCSAGRQTRVRAGARPARVLRQRGVGLRVVGPGEQDRAATVLGQQLGDDRRALLGVLPGAYTASGRPWRSERWWSTRAKPRSANGSRRRRVTASSAVRCLLCTSASSWRSERFVHVARHYPAFTMPASRFLGPPGTFTEEALLSQADWPRPSSCRCGRCPTCCRRPIG